MIGFHWPKMKRDAFIDYCNAILFLTDKLTVKDYSKGIAVYYEYK